MWYREAESKEETMILDWLDSRPFTTLFVCGNHENFDRLYQYPIENWHGGKVHKIRESVIHLMRGQVFKIAEKKIFSFGGASSHDIQDGILEPDAPDFLRRFQQLNAQGAAFRVNHRSWWREELPSESEYAEARANLDRAGWTVDYLLTHCGPTSIQNDLLGPLSKPDALTDFLEEIGQRCQFKYHFFGHYHRNEIVRKKCVLLYEQIIRLK